MLSSICLCCALHLLVVVKVVVKTAALSEKPLEDHIWLTVKTICKPFLGLASIWGSDFGKLRTLNRHFRNFLTIYFDLKTSGAYTKRIQRHRDIKNVVSQLPARGKEALVGSFGPLAYLLWLGKVKAVFGELDSAETRTVSGSSLLGGDLR